MSDEILTPESQTAAEEIAQILATPVETEIPAAEAAPAEVACEPQPVCQPEPVYAPVPQPVCQPEPVYAPVPQPVCQPEPQPKKKVKKNLPLGVRILLKFLTVILCILLTISLTATMLVLDLNALVSRTTLVKALDQVLLVPVSQPRLSENPGDAESLVVDLIYDAIYNREDNDLTVTKDEIASFVEDGSISDFLVDKSATYVEDFIKGTQNGEITSSEVEDLLDENKDLIEEVFEITLDEETRQDILGYIEENDLNEMVHEQIFQDVEAQPLLSDDFTVGDLLEKVRFLLDPMATMLLIGLDVLLAVLIFFTKRMRLGGTLLTVGSHALAVGLTGSIPLMILWFVPGLLADLGVAASLMNLIDVFVGAIASNHLTIVGIGVVLMIAGIVFKIVLRPKKAAN